MPHIEISMHPGRSQEVKENLAKKIHQTTVETLSCAPDVVSVSIKEYPPEEFVKSMGENLKNSEILVKSKIIPGE